MTLSPALRDAALQLSSVSETPRLDAELLMAHALGLSRSEILLRQSDLAVPDGFAALLARRRTHEPVAYITGRQAFWDLEFKVNPDVLIPRADSETLIEAALEAFTGRERPLWILDLGTGSGALLLAALSAFPKGVGVGIDASIAALAVAQDNAAQLGFGDRTAFRQLSWNDAGWVSHLDKNHIAELVDPKAASGQPRLADKRRSSPLAYGSTASGLQYSEKRGFDLILCNPPYIENGTQLASMVSEYEPHSALFAGPDGLDDYRILIPAIPALLAPQGLALFEIGSTQAEDVSNLATRYGLCTEMRRDLAGNPRCLRFSLGIGDSED